MEQLYRRLSATYVAQDKLLDAQQMLDSITDPAIRASLEAARPAAPALTPDGGEFSDYITVSVSAPSGTVYVSVTEQYRLDGGRALCRADRPPRRLHACFRHCR